MSIVRTDFKRLIIGRQLTRVQHSLPVSIVSMLPSTYELSSSLQCSSSALPYGLICLFISAAKKLQRHIMEGMKRGGGTGWFCTMANQSMPKSNIESSSKGNIDNTSCMPTPLNKLKNRRPVLSTDLAFSSLTGWRYHTAHFHSRV